MNRLKLMLALCLAAAGCQPEYGWADCHQFFVKRHHAVHHAVVQQVVAVPYAYYAAGDAIIQDALAEKITARVVAQLRQAIVQAPQQQHAAPQPQQAPSPRPSPSVFAKCAGCHSGPNAAGGLVLDGQTGVSCLTYFRWGQIAGQGKGVPPKMAAVMNGLTPEEKGAINDALLDLVQPTPTKVPSPSPIGDLE